MLSKKYYKAIAEIIVKNKELGTLNDTQHSILCRLLAEYFQKDNERFDYDRFLKACNVSLDDRGVI